MADGDSASVDVPTKLSHLMQNLTLYGDKYAQEKGSTATETDDDTTRITLTGRQKLNRFLLYGSDTSTVSVKRIRPTPEAAQCVIDLLEEGDGAYVVQRVLAQCGQRGVPGVFALALCSQYRPQSQVEAQQRAYRRQSKRTAAGEPPFDPSEKEQSAFCYWMMLNTVSYEAMRKVCVTAKELLLFVSFCQQFAKELGGKKSSGWGHAHRKAIIEWYKSRPLGELACLLTKCRKYDNWTHASVLKKAHPKSYSMEYKAIITYAIHGSAMMRKVCGLVNSASSEDETDSADKPAKKKKPLTELDKQRLKRELVHSGSEPLTPITELLSSIEQLVRFKKPVMTDKNVDAANEQINQQIAEAIQLIKNDRRVSKEHLAPHLLAHKDVWDALLRNMNVEEVLGNMLNLAICSGLDVPETRKTVVESLNLGCGNKYQCGTVVDPFYVLQLLCAYRSGGRKKRLWTVHSEIEQTLANFYETLLETTPEGGFGDSRRKHILLAVDVSNSMRYGRLFPSSQKDEQFTVNGFIDPGTAVASLACFLTTAQEDDCQVVAYQTDAQLFPVVVDDDGLSLVSRLDAFRRAFIELAANADVVDFALPIKNALLNDDENVDLFLVVTDHETGKSRSDPPEALLRYRSSSPNRRHARLMVVSLRGLQKEESAKVAQNEDGGVLEVDGFDYKVMSVVHQFVAGQI